MNKDHASFSVLFASLYVYCMIELIFYDIDYSTYISQDHSLIPMVTLSCGRAPVTWAGRPRGDVSVGKGVQW